MDDGGEWVTGDGWKIGRGQEGERMRVCVEGMRWRNDGTVKMRRGEKKANGRTGYLFL